MAKICQKFQASAIVDCFAGPGFYEDGLDGSPVVIANTFLGHSKLAKLNLMRLICLEKRPDRRDTLAVRLASLRQIPKIEIPEPRLSSIADRFA